MDGEALKMVNWDLWSSRYFTSLKNYLYLLVIFVMQDLNIQYLEQRKAFMQQDLMSLDNWD